MPIGDGTARPSELGVIGEYRVDGGLWRSVMGAMVDLPDGGHAIQVRLYGWCRYEAAVRGSGGVFDVFAIPLIYHEPKGVPVPMMAAGHKLVSDVSVDGVTYIEPELFSVAPQVNLN